MNAVPRDHFIIFIKLTQKDRFNHFIHLYHIYCPVCFFFFAVQFHCLCTLTLKFQTLVLSLHIHLTSYLPLPLPHSLYPQVVAFHFWLLDRKHPFRLSYHYRHCGGYSIPESLAVFVIPRWLSWAIRGLNRIHIDLNDSFFSDCLGDLCADRLHHVGH